MSSSIQYLLPYVLQAIAELQESGKPYNVVNIVHKIEGELKSTENKQQKRGRSVNIAKHVVEVIEYGIKVELLKNENGRIVVSDDGHLLSKTRPTNPSKGKPDNQRSVKKEEKLHKKQEKAKVKESNKNAEVQEQKNDNETEPSTTNVESGDEDNTEDTNVEGVSDEDETNTGDVISIDENTNNNNTVISIEEEEESLEVSLPKNTRQKKKKLEKIQHLVVKTKKTPKKRKVIPVMYEPMDVGSESSISGSVSSLSDSLPSAEDTFSSVWKQIMNEHVCERPRKTATSPHDRKLRQKQVGCASHKTRMSPGPRLKPNQKRKRDRGKNDFIGMEEMMDDDYCTCDEARKKVRKDTPITSAINMNAIKSQKFPNKTKTLNNAASDRSFSSEQVIKRRVGPNCSNPDCLCNLAERRERNEFSID